MSKRNKPDWLQDDVEQALKKAVKNANDRIYHARRKDPNNPDIPDTFKYSEIVASVKSEKGAQRQLVRLQNFKVPKKKYRAKGGTSKDSSASQKGFELQPKDRALAIKALRNQRAKIDRLSKSDPLGRGLLPKKKTLDEFLAGINSRTEFNKAIKDIQKFTARGGEFPLNWTEHREATLKKAIDDFNKELKKLSKTIDPKLKNALPQRVTITQYKKLISTPDDLRREVSALRAFLEPGAAELIEIPDNKYNSKITRWQMEQMVSRAEIVNENRAKRRKELGALKKTDRGEELDYTLDDFGMGAEAERALDPIEPFTPSQGYRDIHAKFRTILQSNQDLYWNKRDAIMRMNYIKSIEDNFKKEDSKEIIAAIENMSPSEFYSRFLQRSAEFETSYPHSSTQYEEFLLQLRSDWLSNE